MTVLKSKAQQEKKDREYNTYLKIKEG